MMFRVGENRRKLESSHILTGIKKDSLKFSKMSKIYVPPNLDIPVPGILPKIVKMGSGEAVHPKEPWLCLQGTWIQFPAPTG